MKKIEDFKTLYEAIQGDFSKYISDIKLYLKKRDSEYKKYLDTIAKIKEKNKKIDLFTSGDIVELTENDQQDLQEIISLQYKIKAKEEKAIFYGGIGNAVYLFCEMNALKKISKNTCRGD